MIPADLARFERRHGALFCGLAVAAAVLVGPSAGPVVFVALAVAVAVLGVPHGALDPAVARFKGLWRTRGELSLFLAAYTVLTLAALALWWAAPPAALLVFLVISAVHFSGDWAGRLSPATRMIAGTAVVTLPTFGHPEAAAGILTVLAPADATLAMVTVMAGIGLPLLGGLAVLLALDLLRPGADPRAVGSAALELGALVALALLVHPVVFFIVYFAALHSPRHTVRALAEMPGETRRFAVLTMLATTLLTLVYAGLVVALLPAGVAADAATLRIVFIGLYALTIPHMALAALPADAVSRLRAQPPRPPRRAARRSRPLRTG